MRWTKNWSKKMKGGVAVGAAAAAIIIGVSVANTGGEDSMADPPVATQTTPAPAPETPTTPDRPAAEPTTPAPAPDTPAVEIDSEETVSQQQARQSAESYLELGGFSRSGLIDQLKYDGFTQAQATHAVDAISPNWNEQAVRSAQSYLDLGGFSRSSLIDQLTYDGFTQAQAVHAANSVGL